MAWTKVKTAVVVGAGLLLAAGTATVTVKTVESHRTYPWQVTNANFAVFYRMPAELKIVPSKFTATGGWCSDSTRGALGIAQPLKKIIHLAYGKDDLRTVVECDLPSGNFDFIAKLVGPQDRNKPLPTDPNWAPELQKEIAKQFGVVGKMAEREADVLVLRPEAGGTRGFKPGGRMPNGTAIASKAGSYSFYHQPVHILVSIIEQRFRIPVVDRSGLTNSYDFSLTWDEPDAKHPNDGGLKQALRDQLGLELVPSREKIEMLVVERVKK